MRTYGSYRVKRKSFYRKSELKMFLLISSGHIGAPKRYTNSLRSKRFQSSYCAKVRAGAKKKGVRGRGRGEEETLARKPHDSEKRPLIFHGLVDL